MNQSRAFGVFLLALFVAACSGTPEVVTRNYAGENETGGNGGDGAGGRGGQSPVGFAGSHSCVPKTCADLGKSCGTLSDDCGGVLHCGDCEEGSVCGLATPNVCSTPDDLHSLCRPVTKAEACAGKQCGVEGDGCGATYSCGDCPQGEACGLEEPFRCSSALSGTDDDCPAKIESCAAAGAECGVVGNGCGGIIDCDAESGGCASGQACGLGGPQKCGALPSCEPLSAAVACAGKCGFVSNGCGVEVGGGTIDCSAMFPCPSGQTCGGAGVANQCGDAPTGCTPLTKAAACAGKQCGVVSDGCDGSYVCGSCSAGALCRSGSCEQASCKPLSRSAACAGKECGSVGDGCGGIYDCGSCAGNEVCGLRAAFTCDAPPPATCKPMTRAQACAGKQCGIAYDGCGTAAQNQFNCGACPSGQLCGAKAPFQCAAPVVPPCTPNATSCSALGWECGLAVNSCGTVYDCAKEGLSCGGAQSCVGGLNGPARCQNPGGARCPLCAAVPDCSGRSQKTRLTGRVITPGRDDANTGNQVGVPNAYVYILQSNDPATLPAISSGIPGGSSGESCERCQNEKLGPVLASTTTTATGNFVLEGNIPVGEEFLLVVKAGKFRRAAHYTLPLNAACATTNLPTSVANNPTRLPRTMSDGLRVNIPRIAVTTGPIDAMECVFNKMGIATREFANGAATAGGARVHLYRGGSTNNPSGARLDNRTPHDTTLYSDPARMRGYDMIVADCEGASWDSSFAQRDSYGANVRDYVNRGGRLFASHLSYSWLHENGTRAYATGAGRFATGLGPAATWDTSLYLDESGRGAIAAGRPQASPRIQNFTSWMIREDVVANATARFTITDPRSSVTALGTATEEFVYRTNGNQRTQQFSFNTPYAAPATAACGRVAYSGFHVAATGGGLTPFANARFPDHCAGDLTGQEKVLLYMLFDLGACVGGDPVPPTCTKQACPAYPSCGTRPDGCGGTQSCGCPSGESCINGQCKAQACVPTTCQAEGAICATISDGCGHALVCPCPVCKPLSKQQACAKVKCGYASDGCSGAYQCSDCAPDCTPLTKCPADVECGVIGDGCNGKLDCGRCPAPQVCGAGGKPNRCDVPHCTPLTCAEQHASCGVVGDGCGSSVECGQCPPGQVCRTVDGEQRCEGCQPTTCASAGAECGRIGDGCGSSIDCGPCPQGQICGAEAPNRCGQGSDCAPRTCEAAGASCGIIGDGCGAELDCGPCPPGEVCGIEKPFQCAPPPPCVLKTCEAASAECGLISDGCDDLVDCGECPDTFECGLAAANRCGKVPE